MLFTIISTYSLGGRKIGRHFSSQYCDGSPWCAPVRCTYILRPRSVQSRSLWEALASSILHVGPSSVPGACSSCCRFSHQHCRKHLETDKYRQAFDAAVALARNMSALGTVEFQHSMAALAAMANYIVVGTWVMCSRYGSYGNSLDVSANSLDVSANSLDVSADSLDVSADSLDVSADSLDVSANSLDVSADSLDVRANRLDVSADSLDVSANSLDVSANSLDVSANSLDVSADSLDVSANSLDVSANSLDVSADSLDVRANRLDVSTDSLDVSACADTLDVRACADTLDVSACADTLDVSADSLGLSVCADSLDFSADGLHDANYVIIYIFQSADDNSSGDSYSDREDEAALLTRAPRRDQLLVFAAMIQNPT